MGVGLYFAVAVVFLFLALRTKVGLWQLSSPLKDKRRVLTAVSAPVPIVTAASFNIIDYSISLHVPIY